jgi:hypothetical protein
MYRTQGALRPKLCLWSAVRAVLMQATPGVTVQVLIGAPGIPN